MKGACGQKGDFQRLAAGYVRGLDSLNWPPVRLPATTSISASLALFPTHNGVSGPQAQPSGWLTRCMGRDEGEGAAWVAPVAKHTFANLQMPGIASERVPFSKHR